MLTNQPELALREFPSLHTERLDLVEINQHHLKSIFKIFGDENVTRFNDLLPFTSEQEAQNFIDRYQTRFNNNLGIRWGISLKGEQNIIGTIGFKNFTKQHRANIGYDLQTEYWNKGFMTEALRAVIDFGFNQLKINRIEAEVMQGNENSERLLLKHNFKIEGVLRQWIFWNDKHYDMSMFSLLKMDYNRKEITNYENNLQATVVSYFVVKKISNMKCNFRQLTDFSAKSRSVFSCNHYGQALILRK